MDTIEQKPEAPAANNPVAKCVKFFKSLMNLTQKQKYASVSDASDTVKSLIESLINGTIKPEVFTEQLESTLKSKTQPQLLTFIYNTLPAVRTALLSGEQSIEGIRYTGHLADESSSDNQSVSAGLPGAAPEQVDSVLVTENVSIVKQEQSDQLPQRHATAPDTTMLSENMSAILDVPVLINRLIEQVPNCEGVDRDVITKISETAENHLLQLLRELSEIAGHRTEPLRTNPLYQQINDPRKQLKFVEEYEKKMFELREIAADRETHAKSSKTKAKEGNLKAKEMKNANQEEKLNREVNDAAILALGGGSRGGVKSWNKKDPWRAPIGQGMSVQPPRPRVRRITLRDFQCWLDCKNTSENWFVKSQLAYGLFRLSDQQQSNNSDQH